MSYEEEDRYLRAEIRRIHTCGRKLKHVESAQSLSPKIAISPKNCVVRKLVQCS